MRVVPELLDGHAELAADALDGISLQATCCARFLRRGDDVAAIETYKRILALHREFASPSLKIIEQAMTDTVTGLAAVEWRAERDASAKKARVARR